MSIIALPGGILYDTETGQQVNNKPVGPVPAGYSQPFKFPTTNQWVTEGPNGPLDWDAAAGRWVPHVGGGGGLGSVLGNLASTPLGAAEAVAQNPTGYAEATAQNVMEGANPNTNYAFHTSLGSDDYRNYLIGLAAMGGGIAAGGGFGAAEAGAGAGAAEAGGSALPATGMVGTGELSAAEAATWGVGAGAGTGTGVGAGAASTGGGGLLGSLVGSGGSNIPAWLGLFGNIWAANQAGGGENAGAADPFASQRPYYQEMLRNLLENPASFQETPMFQTALETGTQAIDRSASARGLLGSGARLAELEKYGVGLANQNFMQYLNALTPLTGATTGSPAAAGQLGQAAQMNQTNAYLQALRSASPLLMQFATWGQGD